jgi:hypothetical protein
MEAGTSKRTDSWFRKLKDECIEVHLVAEMVFGGRLKIRASGPEAEMWRVVALFEELTGKAVEADWRRPPRMGPRPMRGQITIEEALDAGPDDLP